MPPRHAALALALLLGACSFDNDPTVTTPAITGTGVTTAGGPGPTSATLPTLPTLPATTVPGATPPPGDPAVVVDVLDGDSLVVAIDGVEEELRLLGINAPEGGECLGDEARQSLGGRLQGTDVTLVAGGGDDRDQFGRLLRYVYVGGANMNQTMLRNGFAVALSSGHPLETDFEVAEERAVREAIGMWSPQPCGGPAPQRAIGIVAVASDPPGPDDADLNSEYVDIRNNGELLAEMGGWVLRDESSQNRYVFPDGYQLFPLDQVRVHVGCGEDTREDLYWCETRPVWNNGGDSVLLFNTAGSLIARVRY